MSAINDVLNIYMTNENIMLSIFITICNVILNFIIIKSVIRLFNIKVSRNRKIILLCTTSIFSSIFGIFAYTPYFKIINMMVYFVLFLVCLNTKIEKALLSINYICLISIIGETIFFKIFGLIFSVKNSLQVYRVPIYRISNLLLIFAFFILIFYILIINNFKLEIDSFFSNDKIRNKNLILLEFIFTMNIIILNLRGLTYFSINRIVFSLILVNTVIIGIIVLKEIWNDNKRQELNLKIENLKIHNKNLLNMYDDMRSFKHDFVNIIQALGGYIETENLEGLMEMYSRLQKELCIVNDMESLNPAVINNAAVYNLLNNKYYVARKYNICMKIEVMLDINELKIDKLDLCRILGILLDNAIEAAKECNKKEILVRFVRDCKVDRNLVIVENSYKNYDVDIDKIFSKEYTSKKEKKSHGLGLWRVKKILDQSENLNLYSSKGLKFRQQLEIYDLKNAITLV